MNSKMIRVGYWLLPLLFLVGAGWSLNIAMYNWFAADLHDKYSKAYALRGNVFSMIALALFVAFIVTLVRIFRSWKKRKMAQA